MHCYRYQRRRGRPRVELTMRDWGRKRVMASILGCGGTACRRKIAVQADVEGHCRATPLRTSSLSRCRSELCVVRSAPDSSGLPSTQFGRVSLVLHLDARRFSQEREKLAWFDAICTMWQSYRTAREQCKPARIQKIEFWLRHDIQISLTIVAPVSS